MSFIFARIKKMMQLNYIEKGEGDNIAVLMHGWSGSSASLLALQNQLVDKGYHVYNLDLPGFGGTNIPETPYSLDDYVTSITNFLKAKNIQNPVLVGHSFGGKISLKLAAQEAYPIKSVVAIGASGIMPKNSLKKKLLEKVAKAGKRIISDENQGAFATSARKLFYKFVVREKDYYKSGALKQTFINIVNEHLDQLLPKIKVPVLLIWGEQDSVTPLWMGEKMNELIKESELKKVPESKHNLPLVNPEIVAEIIYNKFK